MQVTGWQECGSFGLLAFSLASRCWADAACRVPPLHLELAVMAGASLGHALGAADVLHAPEVEAAFVLVGLA